MIHQVKPRLSIGMPVYNGERFVKEALDSILSQSFENFELIISDNASTDGTEEICRVYVQQDPRIQYHRNQNNLGAARNYNHVFQLSKAEYFKWAAHDDVLAPEFLGRCVSVLDQHPETILCFSKVNRINEIGQIDGVYDNYDMRVSSTSRIERFQDLVLFDHYCTPVFGVMRNKILSKTKCIEAYVGSDRILLAELGLMGPFYQIPDYLFYRRDHPQASVRAFKPNQRLSWFDPRKNGNIALPNWRKGIEFFRAVSRVKMTWHERFQCYKIIMFWFREKRKKLFNEITYVATPLLHSRKNTQ